MSFRISISSAHSIALCTLAGVLLGSCHKEPPSETVRALSNAGVEGNPQAGFGGTSAGDQGIAGTAGASSMSGSGGDSGEGDGGEGGSSGDDRAGSGGQNASGDSDGDGDAPGHGDGDGDADAPGDGDGDANAPGDGDGDDPILPTPPFTKAGLLKATGECAMRHYADFLTRARALEDAADAYADAPSTTTLDAARAAWRDANASWQRAEAFRFGPAAKDAATGGQSLRDLIYAFPYVNRCGMDTAVLNEDYAGSAFTSLNINVRGLAAVEYLLFRINTGNACSPGAAINTSGTWAALGADTVTQHRAHYAARAAADLALRAQTLVDAWADDGGDFLHALETAGSGSAVFSSQQTAFNAINEALYYIELETKDMKLGTPLGFTVDCLNAPDTCPNSVESLYARVSTDNLRQNLIGIRKLFQGCGGEYSGLGFDDWLGNVGGDQMDLASDMIAALQGAQNAVDALDPPLETSIVSDPGKVATVHAAVKAFTDLLKTQFISVLNLEPPAGTEGDND